MDNEEETVEASLELIHALRRLFRGKPPEVVGTALAESLATLVAGHRVEGSEELTNRIRDNILAMHLAAVRELIPVEAEAIFGPTSKPGAL